MTGDKGHHDLIQDWFSKNLGDAMIAWEEVERIKAALLHARTNAPRAAAMAVFIRHESEGRLHCEVMAYFSPAARAVAESVGAVPCSRPAADNLELLAGSDDAWALVIP